MLDVNGSKDGLERAGLLMTNEEGGEANMRRLGIDLRRRLVVRK